MKKPQMKTLFLLALLVGASVAWATTPVKIAKPAATDLRADHVVTMPATKRPFPVSRDAVDMNWAMAAETEVSPTAQPHIAASKGYWRVVDGTTLADGMMLPVTQTGALVRISPVPQAAEQNLQAISAQDVVLVSETGEAFSMGSGTRPLLDPNMVRAKDLPFNETTSVFYLNDAVGSGELTLFVERMALGLDHRYVVHVLEHDSDVALHMQANHDTYFAGQMVEIDYEISNLEQTFSAANLRGRLIDPAGNSYDMHVVNGQVSYTLPSNSAVKQGLWQVELTVEAEIAGTLVRRDARTAFAVSQPTARLRNNAVVDMAADILAVDLTLDVGTPGRYEARAMLFGTNDAGESKAIAVSHVANWFAAGEAHLTLRFDTDLLEASGLQAPYQIKDLRLIHQDAMSLLHRQAQALTINP